MSNFWSYIKNNISVFSFFSLLIITLSAYKIITIDSSQARHIDPRVIYYFAIVFAVVVLLFDYVFKKIFSERRHLNLIQTFITIAFTFIIYIKYFH